MRTEQSSLVERDHLSWSGPGRGYYVPVKAVVDGGLCETYATLRSRCQLQANWIARLAKCEKNWSS